MATAQLDGELLFSSSDFGLNCHSSSYHARWKRSVLNSNEKQHIPLLLKRLVPKKPYLRIFTLLFMLGVTATLMWLSLALSLPRRNEPSVSPNRISTLLNEWESAANSTDLLSPWNPYFSKDITPMPCHSHNDYQRAVPLFEALAAGCTGVEADLFLPTNANSTDLLVGHKPGSLTQDRTLQSLYVGPLVGILKNLNNHSTDGNESGWNGVFQSSPNTTLTLLLDFKSPGAKLWPYVNDQLESLRSRNWLTHWSSSKGIVWAPIIVVASGNAPFDLLNLNTTYRDVFYDAPLDDISNSIYNDTNSYYASVSMSHTLGRQWLWRFTTSQLKTIKSQVIAADSKGLKARYWDTPSWPVTFKDYILGVLIENGIAMLNVDGFSSGLYFPLLTKFGQNRLVW